MSSYKHKSGSQKRKAKEIRDIEAFKGQTSLNKFLKKSSEGVSSASDCVSSSEDGQLPSVTEPVPVSPGSDSKSSQLLENQSHLTKAGSNLPEPVLQQSNLPIGSTVEETTSKLVSPIKYSETETDIPSASTSPTPYKSTPSTTSSKHFDIGSPSFDIDNDIGKTHEKLPSTFPHDSLGFSMPTSIFKKKLANGEYVERDWLVWSKEKQALFCLPCKVFSPSVAKQSALASAEGWSSCRNWRKLHARVPEHEKSDSHKTCYLQWRSQQIKHQKERSLSDLLYKSLKHEQEIWRGLLRRLLDVTLFLAERGLAFRGDSDKIGDSSNGNFLGILELLAKYDPLLSEHLKKVRHSQETGKKLQVSYLSPEIQNEFIEACGSLVRNHILTEREEAKYFSLIVDATPDSAHVEQTTFLLRYVHRFTPTENIEIDDKSRKKDMSVYKIQERLLAFVDCSSKTGEAIYDMIKTTLSCYNIPLHDCRGQGYDNGSNMKGTYKGVQARMLEDNNLAVYSACACHSLNLCGEQAASSCREADTFFGVVQKLYNTFSSSPQRWEILQNKIGCSLHSSSQTRWSAKVESVKPVAAHLPSLIEALNELSLLNLSSDCRRDIDGLKKYLKSFDCLLLASIWFKILKTVDIVNRIIQAREATIAVACENIKSLLNELQNLRDEGWEKIWKEVEIVARNIGWPDNLNQESKRKKKRKQLADEENEEDSAQNDNAKEMFKRDVYLVILDEVLSDLRIRFKSLSEINTFFSVLWEFKLMPEDDIKTKTSNLVLKYRKDLQEDLTEELESLKKVYNANFGQEILNPLDLLNQLYNMNISNMFPNLCIGLRIFLTMPATVASAERSFSTLKRIKNVMRSTMTQNRLSSLGVLAVEAELAKSINMDDAINDFAARKARRKLPTMSI